MEECHRKQQSKKTEACTYQWCAGRRSLQRPPAGTREPGLPERPEHFEKVRAPTPLDPIAKIRFGAPASNRIDIALALALALALAPQPLPLPPLPPKPSLAHHCYNKPHG